MRIVILVALVFSGMMINSCSDQTFSVLPEILINQTPYKLESEHDDPMQISKGKFYRQLAERGYSQVWGNAIFKFSNNQHMQREYEVAWIDCMREGVIESLLVTIDPIYHSLIDIYSYDPEQYRLAYISDSELLPKHTDFMLLPPANRPDTSLIQISASGQMESLVLCCDF